MEELFFKDNALFLREQILKAKQSEMPRLTGFPRSTWSNYERGDSTPSLNDLIKISQFFGVSEYDLLHTNLEVYKPKILIIDGLFKTYMSSPGAYKIDDSGGSKSNIHAQKPSKNTKEGVSSQSFVRPNVHPTVRPIAKKDLSNNEISTGKNAILGGGMPRIITVNERGVDNILYVPIKAQAGYLIGYSDQEYIESLESFRMPGLNNQTFRMFEVQGLSMSPTLSDKDRVIAEWVPNLEEIHENRVHVIIHKEGVAIKRVLNRVHERNKIYLKSDTLTHRQDYPIKEIDPADIIDMVRSPQSLRRSFRAIRSIYPPRQFGAKPARNNEESGPSVQVINPSASNPI